MREVDAGDEPGNQKPASQRDRTRIVGKATVSHRVPSPSRIWIAVVGSFMLTENLTSSSPAEEEIVGVEAAAAGAADDSPVAEDTIFGTGEPRRLPVARGEEMTI